MKYYSHRRQIIDHDHGRDKFTGMKTNVSVARNVLVITDGREVICEIPHSMRQSHNEKLILNALNQMQENAKLPNKQGV